jgi:hypothetical protein
VPTSFGPCWANCGACDCAAAGAGTQISVPIAAADANTCATIENDILRRDSAKSAPPARIEIIIFMKAPRNALVIKRRLHESHLYQKLYVRVGAAASQLDQTAQRPH